MRKKRQADGWDNKDTQALFEAILSLRNANEAKSFFRDLLTEAEIYELAQRWKVARLLAKGTPYREIGRQTWASPRTIARIQKWLKDGRGGYRLVLRRLGLSNKY